NRAASPAGGDKVPVTLSVQAMQVGEDGAPPRLTVQIPVLMQGRRFLRDTPFEFAPGEGVEIVLEAPREIRMGDALLAFMGWALPGGKRTSERTIALRMDKTVRAVAYYGKARSVPGPEAKPLRVTASAGARQVCTQRFTHELVLSWEILDG